MVLWDSNSWAGSSFRELDRMRRRMNRIIGNVTGDVLSVPFPAVNLWTDEEHAVATCELPGVDTENIDISVENDVLSIRGRRTPEHLEDDATFRRHERGHGDFSRTIPLPFAVDAEEVEATYDKGILRIKLPRSEASKPRQIEIT